MWDKPGTRWDSLSADRVAVIQNVHFVPQNAHIVLRKYDEIKQNPVFMHVGTRGTMGQEIKSQLPPTLVGG